MTIAVLMMKRPSPALIPIFQVLGNDLYNLSSDVEHTEKEEDDR